jgi:hypothetical protein
MKFLILINSAPNYQPFFKTIGDKLVAQGHTVVYALESPLGYYDYPTNKIEGDPYIFSNYLTNNPGTKYLPAGYEEVNIWETFFSDYDRFEEFRINRHKTNEWYQLVAVGLFSFFDELMKEEKIDLIIYENISNSFSHVAFEVGKKHKVPYLGWTSSRLPGRNESHTSIYSQREAVAKTYKSLTANERRLDRDSIQWCQKYLDKFMDIAPDYMAHNGLNLQNPVSKYARMDKLKLVSNRFRFIMNEPRSSFPYHLGNPLLFSYKMFRRNTLRFFKTLHLKKIFSEPISSEKYFLYPLHFHPESSTSVWAKHFVNEYVVLKNISFNLPVGHLLYIKDHKSAFGYPMLDFYRKISTLPNVRLIQPEANTKKLIQDSAGVITLTSTVGYEAIILGKPVVVIGDVFYDFHPMCIKMTEWKNLFQILQDAKDIVKSPNNTDKLNFIASYYLNTKEGTLLIGKQNSDELLNLLVAEAINHAFTKKQLEADA